MANLNLDEILSLFENGERRYAEDPIFKSVADSLKMGLGVYAVLDHTLKEVNRLNVLLSHTKSCYNERIVKYEKLERECQKLSQDKQNLNTEI